MRWGMRAESVVRALECSHLRIEIWNLAVRVRTVRCGLNSRSGLGDGGVTWILGCAHDDGKNSNAKPEADSLRA